MNRISVVLKKFSGTIVSKPFITILLCSLFIVFAACSSSKQASEDASGNTLQPKNSAEEERLEDIYWSRIEDSRSRFTQADVEFMTGMIAHHAQALIMSDLAPKNNASKAIQTLASRIINAQQDEIETMQRWLRERNQPVPEVRIDGLILTITMQPPGETLAHNQMEHSHSVHSESNHSGMPGMLTQDQLNELAGLKGEAFDKTFLDYMITHHEGAVTMVKKLFNTDGAALDHQAFRLASDIQADQITEIERMKRMLQNMKDS